MAHVARVDVGPLAEFADGYRQVLADVGFTPFGVVAKRWEAGRLSDWMIANGLGPADLTVERLAEFTALCASDSSVRPMGRRSLQYLVGYLRGLGAMPAEAVGASATEELVARFRVWMIDERGLADRTVGRYEATALRFLMLRSQRSGGCGAEGLSGSDVHEFLLAETARVSVGSAKGRVAELRCLLRFLFIDGWTESSLAASIPPVAGWRDAALPATLTRVEVDAIVAAQDVSTVTGLRNFAIVLILARLGLRAAEVAGLQLDDVDWRCGEIIVRGKTRRDDPLPLPAEVGEAIAAYLGDGRPVTACRAVFITRFAPLGPLAPQSVSKVVYDASRRAGIDPPVCSHRLRHALATDMLRHGAGLSDISQVLRHRDLATTAVYAKVDFGALSELAIEWPNSATPAVMS